MSSRLAEHLRTARQHQFVGRADGKALFQFVLDSPALPFYVLHVCGPGGIGKSTLLREFVNQCHTAAVVPLHLDARNIEPTPDAFLAGLRFHLGLDPPANVTEMLTERAHSHRHVILIDTYENLLPLDDWLREAFLPQLPENIFVVLAGREQPTQPWRADPGWQALLRTLPLRNLNSEEGAAYLRKRGIPEEQLATALAFTHSHPLALSLVADVFDQRPGFRFQPADAPDMIKALLEQFLGKVPGPAHRAALELCCLVRVSNEALLAEVLKLGDAAHDLFNWLRNLSFMESGPEGLFPHDLAREVLHTDLHWRNPDWYAELHRRTRTYYATRFQQSHGQEQQRVLFDLIFLHRENLMVRPYFEWQTSTGLLPDRLRPADVPTVQAMVVRHEGADSGQLAAYWLARQPQHVLVFRNPRGEPIGLLMMLALQELNSDDLRIDPAVRAAHSYLKSHAPLRPGEVATYFRYWLTQESYQAISPLQSLIVVNIIRHYLVTPRLAFTLIPCADPDFWAIPFAYGELLRIPEADFAVGGHHYGVYGHDWRVMPPLAWLALLGEREMGMNVEMERPANVPAVIVLSQEGFANAIKDALQEINRADALRNNPLLASRLVLQRAGSDANSDQRVATLQKLIKETAQALQATPRNLKLYRALHHTYLQPAATQEVAAELLDLPFSTFRRHLKEGLAEVVEMLWQSETGELGS